MIETPTAVHEGQVLSMNDELPAPPPADSGLIQEVYYPKIYLNGFPKSGLHLSVLMAMCLVEGPAHDNPWAGTYQKRGWSKDWMPDWRIYKHLSRIRDNGYMKGHTGYRDDINTFLWQIGAAVGFVYRDLRDVAVSMSYHVTSGDDTNFSHDDKHLFTSLPTHEDVIEACIVGVADYPGLIERWEEYAPWLDQEWVFELQYERLRHEPLQMAMNWIAYVYQRTGEANGVKIDMSQETFVKAAQGMVKAMGMTSVSPTYRKGEVGGWVNHFTPRLKDAFMDMGGGDWLIHLGYEDGHDW